MERFRWYLVLAPFSFFCAFGTFVGLSCYGDQPDTASNRGGFPVTWACLPHAHPRTSPRRYAAGRGQPRLLEGGKQGLGVKLAVVLDVFPFFAIYNSSSEISDGVIYFESSSQQFLKPFVKAVVSSSGVNARERCDFCFFLLFATGRT